MSKNLIINLCLSTCCVNNIRLFCFLTFLQNEKKTLTTAYVRWVTRLKQNHLQRQSRNCQLNFHTWGLELTCKGGFPSNSTIWFSSTSSYNTAFVFLDTYINIYIYSIIRTASQFLYLLMTFLKLFQISRSSSVNKNGLTFIYIIYISLKHN